MGSLQGVRQDDPEVDHGCFVLSSVSATVPTAAELLDVADFRLGKQMKTRPEEAASRPRESSMHINVKCLGVKFQASSRHMELQV